jgi:hypothetical protein
MTGSDPGEADNGVNDQPPSANTKAGEFFVVDHRTFMGACALGLNPAVAYLVIARGAGSRPTSAWSVDAIERYTGISRPKAKLAVAALTESGLITLERSGTRPLYRIAAAYEWQASSFSADERIVLELIDDEKRLSDKAHILTALDLAKRGFLIQKGLKFSRKCDAFFSEEPQRIWLPNAIVDGAADETPPLALLRQTQDVRRLKLFVALYDVNNLPNDGGVSRAILYEVYTLTKVSQRGPLTIWGFKSSRLFSTYSSLFDTFRTGETDEDGHDTGRPEFWSALESLTDCGLLNFVPHVFESNRPEAEMMHAYPIEDGAGEPWEHSVADAAHSAAWACLEPEYEEWAEREGFFLLPLPSHIGNVAVIGVARLKYRPKTRMTAAWFAMSKGRSEAWQTRYDSIKGQNSESGGFDMRKTAT